jgi:hypothetical protein
MHRSTVTYLSNSKSRSNPSRRIAALPTLRRVLLWMSLAGAVAFSAGPLAASVEPAALSTSGTASALAVSWVEPGPLSPDQDTPIALPATPVAPDTAQPANGALEPIEEGPTVMVDGAAKGGIGRPTVEPIVEIKTTYDDNIFISPTHPQSDYYTTVVAGLAVVWGEFRDQLTPLGSYQESYEQLEDANNASDTDFDNRQYFFASYAPGYTYFARHGSEDTLDQNASLGARGIFGNLTVNATGSYRLFSEGVAEVGNRVRQSQINFAVDALYQFSARTTGEVDLSVVTHHYDKSYYVDSDEWIDRNYLSYQLFPKTNISGGFTLGYVNVNEGSDQTYEQAVGRIVYDAGSKLTANLFGGIEFRQFVNGEASVTNPVFDFELAYAPFDGTNINLSAARVVANSAEYAGRNDVGTTVSLTISQALYEKLTLSVQGSYENYDYGAGGGIGGVQRTDNAIRLELAAAFHVTKFMSVNLAYDYWHNNSNLSQFTFDDNRVSLDLDLLF